MVISVIVATYNCAQYIEDTLNSVYRQTYRDIELIYTDDRSKDDSVAIANKWIEAHKERFVRVAQTKTEKNKTPLQRDSAHSHPSVAHPIPLTGTSPTLGAESPPPAGGQTTHPSLGGEFVRVRTRVLFFVGPEGADEFAGADMATCVVAATTAVL